MGPDAAKVAALSAAVVNPTAAILKTFAATGSATWTAIAATGCSR